MSAGSLLLKITLMDLAFNIYVGKRIIYWLKESERKIARKDYSMAIIIFDEKRNIKTAKDTMEKMVHYTDGKLPITLSSDSCAVFC